MARKIFLRRVWQNYSKLGKGRKKKQTWRKPRGRDNKMRENRKGHSVLVSIGFRGSNNIRGKINDKIPMVVKNIKDLERVKSNQIAIIGNVGGKKKMEIVKKAKEMKVPIQNVNIEKFLKSNQSKKNKEDTKIEVKEKKSEKKESKK